MNGRECKRNILKCGIRSHDHKSTNIGVFLGLSEEVCNFFQQISTLKQEKYIKMHNELTDENSILSSLKEILSDCSKDNIYFKGVNGRFYNKDVLYAFICIYFLNTSQGRNLLLENSSLLDVVKNKIADFANMEETNPYYVLSKQVNIDLEVNSHKESLLYYFTLCKKGKSFISDFYKKVDDSDNIFFDVLKYL